MPAAVRSPKLSSCKLVCLTCPPPPINPCVCGAAEGGRGLRSAVQGALGALTSARGERSQEVRRGLIFAISAARFRAVTRLKSAVLSTDPPLYLCCCSDYAQAQSTLEHGRAVYAASVDVIHAAAAAPGTHVARSAR